jgi:hypothetical protein
MPTSEAGLLDHKDADNSKFFALGFFQPTITFAVESFITVCCSPDQRPTPGPLRQGLRLRQSLQPEPD